VRFGSTVATVTSWSNNVVVATVPNLATGATPVTVVANGFGSNALNFTVTTAPPPPAIGSLSPTSGPVGASLTISGSNFGATQGTSTVRFGTTNASITSWSNTQIVASVPGVPTGTSLVTVTVGGRVSNSVNFNVSTVTQPGYTMSCNPPSLTVNRGASGSSTCTLTRTGNFTGAVAFSVTGLPTGVSAAFSPASTTGNSTVLTLNASSTAALGMVNLTVTGTATGLAARTSGITLTVASGPTGGVVTATGAVTSNSPWFAEEQVRFSNTATLTALTVTITVARNPAGLASGGQYNTIGGSTIAQSVSTTSTQLVYTFTLAAGQQLAAGTGRTFAAQLSPGGTSHPTSGDNWSVTYTSGGTTTTASGTF
jgi:endoglucanase